MKTLLILMSASLMLTTSVVQGSENESAQKIQVTRSGSQPSREGPEENFTGSVRVDPLFTTGEETNKSAAYVTFQSGARAAWHTHPNGQILVVTVGTGRVQQWGDPAQEIRTGDVVWIPPGVKHWHGAGPTTAMTHIAIQDSVGGKAVEWMEKVTDEQYQTTAKTDAPRSASVQMRQPNVEGRRLSPDDVLSVAPALENYTQERLYGDLWNRPGLGKRDRSLITIAAMIARGQAGALTYYFDQALENGVKPGEVSGVITHLAFYSGWGNAFGAVGAAKDVFARRGIGADQLPAISGEKLPLDEKAEAQRAARVSEQFEAVAPGIVEYTTDLLFRDLWLRPDLAPRDRSLVTVSALIAAGQVEQVSYHLGRAMDNGLTKEEAGEVITHLAFYAGWPKAFSALPVAKELFEKRTK